MEWIPRELPSKAGTNPICVPPKVGQKRPTTSPAPVIASPHNFQSSSGGVGITSGAVPSPLLNAINVDHNVCLSTNHPGGQSQVVTTAPQAQQKIVGMPGGLSTTGPNARGPFAAALRNLAKQADIKEEDDIETRERNERSLPPGAAQSVQSNNSSTQNSNSSRLPLASDRLNSSGASGNNSEERCSGKKYSVQSPQPPEKVARLNSMTSAGGMQPELLARSGFQPYRSDERMLHSASAFQIDGYSPFSAIPGMPPGAFLNPAGLPYSEQLYLDQRYQMLRAAGVHHTHPHALYPSLTSAYAPHLYSMIPAAALGIGPALHERIKLEEEHRARIVREEERERELQREKERELREQREREREQREREQREREQREKEKRDKEQKEKEAREREFREIRERERQQLLSTSVHYSNQLYSPLGRNILGTVLPHLNLSLRPPSTGLHGLSPLSPYHSGNQRQNLHAMSLNFGLSGIPPLSHGPAGIPHHLQHAAMGLAHSAASGLSHPGFSTSTLGLTHHGLTHPHMPPHPAMTSGPQVPPHVSPNACLPNTSTASPSPHSLNLSANNSNIGSRLPEQNIITSSAASPSQGSISIVQPHNINPLYYAHNSSHMAPTHATAAAPNSMSPYMTQQGQGARSLATVGTNHAVSSSPISMKIPTSTSSGGTPVNCMSNMLIQNDGNLSESPHSIHHTPASQAATPRRLSAEKTINAANIGQMPLSMENATLDLSGSNSNSSNQAPSSTINLSGINARNINSAHFEMNVAESGSNSNKDRSASKNYPLKSSTPPTSDRMLPTPINAAVADVAAVSTTGSNMLLDSLTPEDICHSSPISGGGTQLESKLAILEKHSNNENQKNVELVSTSDNNFTVFQSKISPVSSNVLNELSLKSSAKSSHANIESSKQYNLVATSIAKASSPTSDFASNAGVTSTTSGTTSPPVVSSSTNLAHTPPNIRPDEAVSSATPPATFAKASSR